MLNKTQLILVVAAVATFVTLYFGCDVKVKGQGKMASAAALEASNTQIDLAAHALEVLATLPAESKNNIEKLMQTAEKSPKDVATLKQLSGAFHTAQHDDVAAFFAEKVADIERTDEAYSIAGANYFQALRSSEDPAMRDFLRDKAAAAFENAAKANDKKLEHRINLALCYTEQPLANEPMRGILILRELDAQNPDNEVVNIQLARLALKTNQFEKAIDRLEKLLVKYPKNGRAICLLADAYTGKGDAQKAQVYADKCKAAE